jgi:aryl-alcohol dehydrogenase-like predicted oxidoreductase
MSEPETHDLPRAPFGPDGPEVSRIGLGGEGILRTFGEEAGAAAVIGTALELGLTYFDSAPAYAGSEAYLGAVWREHPEARARVFQTSKSARRDYQGAKEDLARSLERLGTDHLDLWQVHDVRTMDEVQAIAGPDGALRAFQEARDQGLVRRIGVTGHHDPAVLTACVRDWPVDSVLLPVNPVEGALGGFLSETLPLARARGLAVVGMKALGGGHYVYPQGRVTAELLVRYALSQDVDAVIVGCSLPDHVRTLARIASSFSPIPAEAQAELIAAFKPHAARLAFYRGKM